MVAFWNWRYNFASFPVVVFLTVIRVIVASKVLVNLMTVQVESNGESAIRLKISRSPIRTSESRWRGKKIKDLMFLFYHLPRIIKQ
jgi:hypothetical protein